MRYGDHEKLQETAFRYRYASSGGVSAHEQRVCISGEAFIATPGEVNLRDSGSFNSNVIDAAPQGATVYVLGDAGYGWYKVSYNGKTGYMASYYLLFNEVPSAENVDSVPDKAPAQETTQEPVQQPAQGVPSQTYVAPPATGDSNATVLGSGICFRSGPSTYSSVIETLETGTPIPRERRVRLLV